MADQAMTVQALVQEVMLRSLTDEAREKLLRDAIADITTRKKADYGRELPSSLELAFYRVCTDMVRDHLEKALREDVRVKDAIGKIVTETVAALLNRNVVDLANGIAATLAEKIARSDR